MKLIRHFSIYTLVSFLGAGIGFFLMPFLSHYLKPSEYGITAMVNSVVTILIPFISVIAAGLITVEYYRIKDEKEFASFFSSIQLIPLIPFGLFLIASFFFSKELAHFLEIPADKSYWIILSVVLALFTIYYETLLSYAVIEKKPIFFGVFNMSRLLVEVALTVFFIARLGWGWEGRLLAWLISATLMLIVSIWYFYKKGLITAKVSRKHFMAGLAFGLPLILHTVGKFVVNQSDRIFIVRMISLEEAGIYNIGYQVGMVLLLIVNAAGNFFQPFLFERLANLTEAAKREIVKITYIILSGLLLLLILLALFSPLVFSLFIDKVYAPAVRYVFWVGLSYFFWGVYIVFSGYIFYSKRTSILGKLAILNVLLNLVLNYFLIKYFGALGAAYATCVSFFVIAMIIMWKATRMYQLPWFSFRKKELPA